MIGNDSAKKIGGGEVGAYCALPATQRSVREEQEFAIWLNASSVVFERPLKESLRRRYVRSKLIRNAIEASERR